MKLKQGLFIGMCALLVTVIVMFGVAIGKVVSLFGGNDTPTEPSESGPAPSASQTDPQQTQSQPTEPSSQPTDPSTEPTTPPTQPPTDPPTEPGHVHTWVLTESVAVTCDTYGYNIYTCEGCGKQDIPFDEQVAPTGHSYGPGETVAPSCTQQGYTRYTCSKCGGHDDRNIQDALGHEFEMTESVPPSCAAAGFDLYVCTRCDIEESRNQVPALGHSFSDWVFHDDGSIQRDCSVCLRQQTGADLTVLSERKTVDGSIYMISVGAEGDEEAFLFVIFDNLQNGTMTYSLDPILGLVVTYQTSDGTLVTLTSDFRDTPTVIIPGEDTPPTSPSEPSADPSDPSVDPTDPSTEPTEPSTHPTEPSAPVETDPTAPSEPVETDPTEPSEPPTDPITE